eukprot:3318351-Rhodomonas_salina.1
MRAAWGRCERSGSAAGQRAAERDGGSQAWAALALRLAVGGAKRQQVAAARPAPAPPEPDAARPS